VPLLESFATLAKDQAEQQQKNHYYKNHFGGGLRKTNLHK